MNIFFYILITETFAKSMEGKQSPITPDIYFNYAITTDGRYVCSINSANDFPQDFEALGDLIVMSIRQDEFPPSPIIPIN